MCNYIKKKEVEQAQIITQQNQIEEVNASNVMGVPGGEPANILKQNRNEAREAALKDVREKLALQEEFQLDYEELNLSSAEAELERETEYRNRINEYDLQEKELSVLEEKYGIKDEERLQDDSAQKVTQDIFALYYANQHGNVKKMLNDVKTHRNEIEQILNNKSKTIEEKLVEYKDNATRNKEERIRSVNEQFENNKAISSKGKKEKGRKKGLALEKEGVVGATEETAAMRKDMQHCMKRITAWKKKPTMTIESHELEITGREFEVVFKNKSGSAMNIKAVMEKMAKLRIASNRLATDTEEGKQQHIKYQESYKLLEKMLRVVCAANGIDSETGDCFAHETEEEKLVAAKKIEYANAVYASSMAEFEDAVNKLKVGGLTEKPKKEVEQTIEKKVVQKENKTKEQILNDDYAGFVIGVSLMRQRANNPKVDDEVFQAALRMCSSYNSQLFEKEEDALSARRKALETETQLLSDVLTGNVEPIVKYAVTRLKLLEERNITIDSFFDNKAVEADMAGYDELVSLARLVIYAQNQMEDKKAFHKLLGTEFFGKTEFEMHKMFTKLTIIGSQADYENRFAENVNNMKKASNAVINDEQWKLALELCQSNKQADYGTSEEDFLRRKADLVADTDFLAGMLSGDSMIIMEEIVKQLDALAKKGMSADFYLNHGNAIVEQNMNARFEKVIRLIHCNKEVFAQEAGEKMLLQTGYFGTTPYELHMNLAKIACLGNGEEKQELFLSNINKMREDMKEKKSVDDRTWAAALSLCEAYDDSLYLNKEKQSVEQQNKMGQEAEFMSRLLNKDAKAVMQYAFDKLEELEQQDISMLTCFNIESIKQNPQGYTKLAAVIDLINVTREQLTEDRDALNSFVKVSRFKGSAVQFFKLLSHFNVMTKYSDYVEKAKNYDNLPKRQQKILLADAKAMERKCGFVDQAFSEKWTEENTLKAEMKDLLDYEVDQDTQWARESVAPLYDNAVKELQEYVDGINDKIESVKRESRLFELVTKAGKAAQLLITGNIMFKKYEKKVNHVSDLGNNRKRVNARGDVYTEEQVKAYEKVLTKIQADINEYEIENKECDLLREIIAGKDTLTEAERKEKIDAIVALPKKTRMQSIYDDYLGTVAKSEETQASTIAETATISLEMAEHTNKINKYKAQMEYLRKKQDYFLVDDPQQKEKILNEYFEMKRNTEILYDTGKWDEKAAEKEKKELQSNAKKYYDRTISEINSKESDIKSATKEYDAQKEKYEKKVETLSVKSQKPLEDFMKLVHQRLNKHENEREKMYRNIRQVLDNQDQATYDYLVTHMTEEEVSLLMGHRGKVIFDTADNLKNMLANATKDLNAVLEELKTQYTPEELEKYKKIADYTELSNALEKNITFSDDLKTRCLANLNDEEKKIKKNEASIHKMENTVKEAQTVLDEAKDNFDYSQEAKDKSLAARKEFTKKCFASVSESITSKITNVYEKLTGNENNRLGKLTKSKNYVAYVDASEKLMEEKAKKYKESGVSYNTLALQSYLLDYSDAKYDEMEVTNRVVNKVKKKDVYTLHKSDFKATFLKEGFATVNFQNLMYKRMMLMKWLEEHKADAINEDKNLSWYQKVWDRLRSPKQQRYDRRKERLEKLNRYLKLYCEANGVDFETGKLFCEMDELTPEQVEEKVKTASLYLDESSADITQSYFTKEEEEGEEDEEEEEEETEEEKNALLKKYDEIKEKIEEYTAFEKDIFGKQEDEKEDTKLALTEIYSVSKEWEGVLLENEISMRTAHFVGSLSTKIGECKAACKAGVGVGTIEDKKKGTSKYTGGANFEASASFTALSTEFLAKYNRKILGAETEAKLEGKVSVGSASANLNAVALIRDKEGNFSPQAEFELGAELALLKLEAAAALKVHGIGVDAQLSFMLGLAAKAKGSIKNWKLSLGIDVAVGIGFSASIELDFSGLKDKLVEYAKASGTKVKDFVTRRMFAWGINMNSEAMQKLLLEDIDKLDLNMGNLDDISEGVVSLEDEKKKK